MKPKYFSLARQMSKLSDHRQHHIGAVIVKRGAVVSLGCNTMKTHPKSTHPFKSLHAEMRAIMLARCDLRGCDLYVYREHKDGTEALAKPCAYCQMLIEEAGIKNVYYTKTKS